VIDAAGPLLFARYAYPPNELGLCGADSPHTLLQYGDAHASDDGLSELARTFEGAWPYLELIAGANGLDDPLDHRVVEAYWVGNELLDRVRGRDLARHVDERFGRRMGQAREHVFDAIAAGAVPHHCFHVLAVYPWLGLLRTGIVEQPLHVLDQCRTTPAVVQSVDHDSLVVLARPMTWDGTALRLDAPALRRVRWRDGGLSFVGRPRPGDHVCLHWDFVCDTLSPRAVRSLIAASRRTLDAVNSSPDGPGRAPDRANRLQAGAPTATP
jgi:hypothetical protein